MLKNSNSKKTTGNPSVLRKANSNFVREIIREQQPVTKLTISSKTNLSLVTINKLVDELLSTGEIVSCGVNNSKSGRKPKYYKINENYKSILVIFIQENTYYTAIFNMLGNICHSSIYKHDKSQNWTDELLSIIDKNINGFSSKNIEIVGLAIPGSIDNNLIENIPTIKEWNNFDIVSEINKKYYGIDVVLENDINAATIGIYSDIKDISNMVFLHVQKGMKAGIIIDSRLYKSSHNFAGEISFMRLKCCSDEINLENIINNFIENDEKDKLVEVLSQIIINITTIIEPEVFFLESYYFDDSIKFDILKNISNHIERKYIPEIVIINKNKSYYLKGIYMLCMEKINTIAEIYTNTDITGV